MKESVGIHVRTAGTIWSGIWLRIEPEHHDTIVHLLASLLHRLTIVSNFNVRPQLTWLNSNGC
jgi:hypothetical protein